MKKIFRTMLVLLLLVGMALINYSFTTNSVIELSAPSGLDDDPIITPKGGESFTLERGKTLELSNYESCEVETYLLGFGWKSTTKTPVSKITVDFNQIQYIPPEPIRLKELVSQHQDFRLRFFAASAPFWVSAMGTNSSKRLDSNVPFSLQNAVRLGAKDALVGNDVWSRSNWSDPNLLSNSVCLFNYAEDEVKIFSEKLEEIRPQVLFIGSMTLSFPGAIQFATIAKEKFGDDIFVVLGGKHANETIYTSHGTVEHHVGSPTLLMKNGKIPRVFDLVVSGDGEEVVHHIGKCIGNEILKYGVISSFSTHVESFKNVRGKYILSWIENDLIRTYASNTSLDYDILPSPISLFGSAGTNFPVFEKEMTAHVYSDLGKGCVFNCFFCSEGSGINGKISQTGNPAARLYNQLYDASVQGNSVSAFVEDSILLSGNPKYLNDLSELLEENPLAITFGGQFTVDNLLNSEIQKSIVRLSKNGLTYIYTGIETADEKIASEFSKSTQKGSWVERNTRAIQFLAKNDIKCGVSILWGLGENQSERFAQLDTIEKWQSTYHIPSVISMNWATQHPLFNKSSFDYIDWGTDKNSPYIQSFIRLFGEASEKYILSNVSLPSMEELSELEAKVNSLTA